LHSLVPRTLFLSLSDSYWLNDKESESIGSSTAKPQEWHVAISEFNSDTASIMMYKLIKSTGGGGTFHPNLFQVMNARKKKRRTWREVIPPEAEADVGRKTPRCFDRKWILIFVRRARAGNARRVLKERATGVVSPRGGGWSGSNDKDALEQQAGRVRFRARILREKTPAAT